MARFKLNIVGQPPSSLDMEPMGRLLSALTKISPDWLKAGVINIKLVDDAGIRAFNKDYSGNDYATDVLSFSYVDSESVMLPDLQEPSELGDMIISTEMAKSQAEKAGTSIGEELALLSLHGILHIHGFDHSDDESRLAMDQLQQELLELADINYRDFNWEFND